MNRFKCPACGGNQYTSADTAEGCIYCGHKELSKMDTLEPEEGEGMREIKFRVWDTYRNKMIKWDELHSDSNYLCLMVFDGNGYRTRAMQYTGLKDKNGREIYEGDIVELTNTYKGMNTKSIVEIDFIDFTFAGKWAEEYSPSGYMYNPLGSYNFPIVTIEVIGNIYENPDLIEGGAD